VAPLRTRPLAQCRYLSVADAAEYIGVSTQTIRRYIESGRLPAYRLGKKLVKVRDTDLDALMRPIPAARS